jgi:translation initiation factor 1
MRMESGMAKDDYRLVWSSDQGDLRKKKEDSPHGKSLSSENQTVYLHRQTSGRGGKAVTLVKNLALSADGLKLLAKKLKQECGTGGTIRDGVIEIQGEQRERIADILQKLGYKIKVAGG